MKLFVPGADALAMSMALYELHRPLSIRDPQDGTTALFGVREAADKSLWLAVDTALEIRIHPLASLNTIAAILQPFEADGRLPAGTLAGLAAYVEAHRGQRIVVYDAFPDYFKAQALDEAQMIEQGKLSTPAILL